MCGVVGLTISSLIFYDDATNAVNHDQILSTSQGLEFLVCSIIYVTLHNGNGTIVLFFIPLLLYELY